MSYRLEFTDLAERQMHLWRKSGRKKALQKLAELMQELIEHPATGTGQVEQLRGNLNGLWSRRIDKANRLVYAIEEDRVVVIVISVRGHY